MAAKQKGVAMKAEVAFSAKRDWASTMPENGLVETKTLVLDEHHSPPITQRFLSRKTIYPRWT